MGVPHAAQSSSDTITDRGRGWLEKATCGQSSAKGAEGGLHLPPAPGFPVKSMAPA